MPWAGRRYQEVPSPQRARRFVSTRLASASPRAGAALVTASLAIGGAVGVLPGPAQNVVGSTLRAITPFDGPSDDQPRLRAASAEVPVLPDLTSAAKPNRVFFDGTTTSTTASNVTATTTGTSAPNTTASPNTSGNRPTPTTIRSNSPTPTTSNGKENYGAPINVDLQCNVLSGNAGVSCTWTATAIIPNATYTLIRANIAHTAERVLAGNALSTSAFTDTTGVAGAQYEYIVLVNVKAGQRADGRSNTVTITYG